MPRKKRLVPKKPCPDPERYVLVNTERTAYWRLKRGLGGPVTLNAVMQQQADRMKLAMPAARRLMHCLEPYMQGFAPGYAQARMGARFSRRLREAGLLDYSELTGFELQEDYPLAGLLKTGYRMMPVRGKLQVNIQLPAGSLVALKSRLITGYQFQLVLVAGELSDAVHPLEVCTFASPVFMLNEAPPECLLSIRKPAVSMPWILFLKIIFMEQDAPAHHPKYKAMRVIEVYPKGDG